MRYKKIESDEDIDTLVAMAEVIWRSHFGTLFDEVTVDKLIEGAQSKRVILKQVQEGFQYFFVIDEEEIVGYFAYQMNVSDDALFLGKLYLYAQQRGKGIGRRVLHHLEEITRKAGLKKITLTVYYKNLDSIHAYEHWGFDNLGLIKRHFDTGLVFDDIKMEKRI